MSTASRTTMTVTTPRPSGPKVPPRRSALPATLLVPGRPGPRYRVGTISAATKGLTSASRGAWAGDWRSRAKPTARVTTGRTGVMGIDTGAEQDGCTTASCAILSIARSDRIRRRLGRLSRSAPSFLGGARQPTTTAGGYRCLQ